MFGKHTDYAGGRSLLCATEQGFRVAVIPRSDAMVVVTDAATGASERLELDPALASATPGQWSVYPRVVARRFARNFPRARRGADIEFRSDLPQAAGLSSSTALVIAIFLALAAVNRLEEDETYAQLIRSREHLATYLASVENGSSYGPLTGDHGVGTSGGSEDHTAILCCEAGRLSVYTFAPARLERTVPLPAGWVFAVASSGVVAQKTGAARAHYNRAAGQVAELLRRWHAHTGRDDTTLARAIESAPDALPRLRAALQSPADIPLLKRLEQFVEESDRLVPAAAGALGAGDLARFGALVDRSQELAATALGNQVPETIALVRGARTLGAAGASAFGAGFGGSAWALVRASDAGAFIDAWSAGYLREFPQRRSAAAFFITAAGAAAREVPHV